MFGRAKIGSKTGQYPRGDPRGCTSELLDFSGLAGFCPPFRPPVTPELIQTDHLRPPPPKARNSLCRPALRDGVTGWRGACDPLPLSCTQIDRLLHPNILVWESLTLEAHSPHTAPCILDGIVPHQHCHRRTQRITGRTAPWSRAPLFVRCNELNTRLLRLLLRLLLSCCLFQCRQLPRVIEIDRILNR